VAENALNIVALLDGDGNPKRVDGRLDQHSLLLVAGNHHGVHHKLFAGPHFHLRFVVPLHNLTVKVLQTDGSRQRVSDRCQIRLQSGRHFMKFFLSFSIQSIMFNFIYL